MMKTRKLYFFLMICLLFTVAVFDNSKHYAKASDVVLPSNYKFTFGSGAPKDPGSEYNLTTGNVLVSVSADGWAPGTTVSWVSSETGVVETSSSDYGSNYVNLKRVGPGYSTLIARIKQGTNTMEVKCLIKVDLEFDVQATGLTLSKTTDERLLIFNDITPTTYKQAVIKYLDPENVPVAVSGSAIKPVIVTWDSDNESVAEVDASGKITPKSAGSAKITVTTKTLSSQDKPLSISLLVVVKPTFTLTYSTSADDGSTVNHHVTSTYDPNIVNVNTGLGIADDVPSDFVIESNASISGNLTWKIVDVSTGHEVTDAKMTYIPSDRSGNVSFENVKAGTYEIYAFTNPKFNEDTIAPFAYMRVIVPVALESRNIVMTVGDTYNILQNSNLPSLSVFNVDIPEFKNVVNYDKTTSIITAKTKGKTNLILTLNTGLYGHDGESIDISVTVIDGISLSMTKATIFTSATLLLQADASDKSQPITWSSYPTGIVSVVDGLVTGLKPGVTVVTAKQTINGVTKIAKCEVTVQQSVASITVSPSAITIPIGAFQTLHATIKPDGLSGVSLKWKSSNTDVVSISEANDLTATIKGEAGGHAVISAINQDNVVVGYCDVNVQQPVGSIVLSETNVNISVSAKSFQIRATVYPEDAQNKAVTWRSTEPAKAKVDANGIVTLLKSGTVSIIVTSVDNPNVTAICNLNILVPVSTVALDEATKTMYVGESARLTYVLLPANSSTNAVVWSSSNNSVAAVDATGRVTAKGVGTAVIALQTVDGGKSAYCTITVRQVATGVSLDVSELALKVGQTYEFKPALTPKNSTDASLVWESSDTKVAVVDPNGKVTAKGIGVAVIMVKTEAGATSYCKLTVTQPVQGLILNFNEKTIYVGEKFELKVSVNPSQASNLGVTWKSSNTKVADVTKDGIVKGLTGGTSVITVVTVEGGYAATCVVNVRELVTTVKLDHDVYRIGVDKSAQLTATASNQTATNQKVKWKSSNTKVVTVDQKGKITGIAIGEATITATAQDGSEVEATCEVEVVRPVAKVTLNKSFIAMLVGDSRQLKAAISPSNASYRHASWISSDSKVVMVDEDGVLQALTAGTATITAAAQDNSGKKAVCYVTVSERLPATGITLMDKKLVMVPGENKTVQSAITPSASTDRLTWSSDNSSVARVDSKTGKITARATGTANITVMTDSGKTASIEVTVIGLNMTELTIEQYTTYPYALSVEGATSQVTFSIDNPEIAVLNQRNSSSAVISSRAVGKATITASVNGRKLTCKLTVTRIG